MTKLKSSLDLALILLVLGKLAVFVLLHVIIYICTRKIWRWLKETEESENRNNKYFSNFNANGTPNFNYKSKFSNMSPSLIIKEELKESKTNNSDDEHHSESTFQGLGPPKLGNEKKFLKAVDKFCRTGTKIRKSRKSLRYISAIQKNAASIGQSKNPIGVTGSGNI